MGQGGSATSGHGLTAVQVAAALRVTTSAQLERNRPRQVVREGMDGPRRTLSGFREKLHEVDQSKANYSNVFTYTVKVTDSSGSVSEVGVTEYAPEVFRFIRQLEAVDDVLFADEWNLPEDRVRLDLGEGRSQALFLKSKNMAFMCKTIAEVEVHVLLDFLRTYAAHIAEHPNSLLMRFYMLLKVEVGKEVGYILCFGDVFGTASVLNEKWDIKGRVPKPGKFLYFPHLIRRPYEPDPYLIVTPHDEDENAKNDSLFRSRAEAAGVANEDVVVVQAKDKDTLRTQHDKDLTRLFWLDTRTHHRLLQQLRADYKFLRSAGLMDYSLLIGVAYKENKTSRKGKRYVVIKNMRVDPCASPENVASEVRPHVNRDRGADFRSLSEFADGVTSLLDQEIYYVGIIDMLTSYTVKKKAANFFKSFLWEQNTLSTIPPKEYQRRIQRYTDIIFPRVETDSHTH